MQVVFSNRNGHSFGDLLWVSLLFSGNQIEEKCGITGNNDFEICVVHLHVYFKKHFFFAKSALPK